MARLPAEVETATTFLLWVMTVFHFQVFLSQVICAQSPNHEMKKGLFPLLGFFPHLLITRWTKLSLESLSSLVHDHYFMSASVFLLP